ncbi:hypothetical protein YN1HA_7650 [Sulfurisphaera ohwakuensis]
MQIFPQQLMGPVEKSLTIIESKYERRSFILSLLSRTTAGYAS